MTIPSTHVKRKQSQLHGCLRFFTIAFSFTLAFLIIVLGSQTWSTNQSITQSEHYDIYTDAPGQFITVQGYILHYQVYGSLSTDQVPLVLVHGFNVMGGLEWSKIAPELAQQRPVIVPDLLGFGHSQRVTQAGMHYSHAGQAQLLHNLLTQLGITKVDIAGASYGGGIAAQFALDYPVSINKLVLIDAQIYTLGGGIFQTLGSLPLGIGRALTWNAQGAGEQATNLFTLGCHDGSYCPDATLIKQRQRLAQIHDTTDALLAFNASPRTARIPADLHKLHTSTLIIWGSQDTIIDPVDAHKLAKDIQGSNLHIIKGAGHTPHLQMPAETGAVIQQYLAS